MSTFLMDHRQPVLHLRTPPCHLVMKKRLFMSEAMGSHQVKWKVRHIELFSEGKGEHVITSSVKFSVLIKYLEKKIVDSIGFPQIDPSLSLDSTYTAQSVTYSNGQKTLNVNQNQQSANSTDEAANGRSVFSSGSGGIPLSSYSSGYLSDPSKPSDLLEFGKWWVLLKINLLIGIYCFYSYGIKCYVFFGF